MSPYRAINSWCLVCGCGSQKKQKNKQKKSTSGTVHMDAINNQVIQFEHFLICRPSLHFSAGLLPFPLMVHRPAPPGSLVSSTSAVGVNGSESYVKLC